MWCQPLESPAAEQELSTVTGFFKGRDKASITIYSHQDKVPHFSILGDTQAHTFPMFKSALGMRVGQREEKIWRERKVH